jgi:acyl-coenzyme A synthetase/AMP-(fatty) acid ligase
LLSGGVVIATLGFHPGSFLALLDEFRPTWFTSSPPLNRSTLELARRDPKVFPRVPLRLIRCTGTAQTEALTLLKQAVDAPVLACYGLTETGCSVVAVTGWRNSWILAQTEVTWHTRAAAKRHIRIANPIERAALGMR